MTNVTIRVAAPRDLEAVTEVHVRSFPSFFLSALGPRFLRLLYEEILRSENGVLVVADDGSGVESKSGSLASIFPRVTKIHPLEPSNRTPCCWPAGSSTAPFQALAVVLRQVCVTPLG